MTPDQIKDAAIKIADGERLEAMIRDLSADTPFNFGVGGIGLNVKEGGELRTALIAYLKTALSEVQREIAKLTAINQAKAIQAMHNEAVSIQGECSDEKALVVVNAIDDIDAAISKLEAEASPNVS